MTNKEAIEILTEVKEFDDSMYQYNPTYMEALKHAIKVLKATDIIYEDGFSDGYSQRISFEKNSGMLKEW